VKIQYSKLFLSGLFCVLILMGNGTTGHFQPVYAASPGDSSADSSRQVNDASGVVSGVKSDNRSDSLPAGNKTKADDVSSKETNTDPGTVRPVKDWSGTDQSIRAGGNTVEKSDIADLPEKSVKSGKMVLNFDNAELSEVIRTLAELLDINYMLDKGVSGKVTIHTAGELSREDLFPVFYQVLEINGVTAVKDKNIYHIVPMKDAPRLPIMSRMGKQVRIPAGERVVIQVIPLENVSAQEMGKILTPFISQDGTIISQENRNIIVVVDKADNISKILRLVSVFDTDVFERVNHRFYVLEYGDVESIIEIMDKLFLSYGDAIKADASFIPITRLNTLMVVSSNPKVFAEVDSFIMQYDVPSQNTEPGIYVYSVKNGRAGDIADILDKVFTGKKDTNEKRKSNTAPAASGNPFGKDAKQARAEKLENQKAILAGGASPLGPLNSEGSLGSGTLRGEINITADESRNSLIIEAAPADYQIIKNLLTQLDILPRQVLIEVTIAEITLDESNSMGVEWSYKQSDASMSTSLLEANMGDSGLNFTIGNPDRWTATLSALATDNKVNILSTPSILASNSLPAKIDVSQEIPVASSQYQYTNGNDPLVETDIEYRDTGILLSVTPNINDQGLVTMEISQEISEQASSVLVGGRFYPSFYKRSTETTLSVQSGQTIVIGGLIRETKSNSLSGTPWFIDLPVINFLFGQTSDSVSKNELIILISPYVISTPDDIDAITQELSNKLHTLFPKPE
jgi:general secretion pathway protein D